MENFFLALIIKLTEILWAGLKKAAEIAVLKLIEFLFSCVF